MLDFAAYAKAIVGAIVAGLGVLATALTEAGVSASEWVGIVSTTLVAASLVWAVPNRPEAAGTGLHRAGDPVEGGAA